MKPVLIFEHISTSNAGLFETFLHKHAVPFNTLRPNQGEAIPSDEQLADYSGFCFLGGMESVTEPSAAMLEQMRLIRSAKKRGTPMIGHCLGGQLLSKALGGDVMRHPRPEFGWSRLHVDENEASADWLGNHSGELFAMQWHNDVFSLPAGATRIFAGDFCDNQAFVLDNILAMQFHIEISADMIRHWAVDLVDKHPPGSASVQNGRQIMRLLPANYAVSSRLAEQLYSKWLSCLA